MAGGAVLITCALFTPATAAADNPCGDVLGGDWSFQDGACTTSVTSVREANMTMSVGLPLELTDDPTAGPPIRSYLAGRTEAWRKNAATMVRASDSSLDYQAFSRGSLRSVVFHEFQQTVGNMANNGYRTFTFDLSRGRQVQLADLVKPGVDPLTALPPLIRPYLSEALDRAAPPHDPGTYPFTPAEFEPQPDGSGYAGDYRAFAVTPDELILYLPDLPMTHENPWPTDRLVWSMDGGTVTVRVPLTALTPVLAI
ncbi:RsiV family protein [[Mycobacterium] nativiensis]|uniref:RsiV family protein n=1 Tax=[Mycobacterium] nativiensis TaxID=2855503 RepID=A0ABU5XV77_9MYCO|nr:RsiV family protein [Mycolicibacter sp. MYC340]MEB3031828.1 RsiV family protein [Mycolicibacter sp. MYC340]